MEGANGMEHGGEVPDGDALTVSIDGTAEIAPSASSADSAQDKCATCGSRDPPETLTHRFDDGEGHGWVYCDVCNRWFHEICVKSEEYERDLVEQFHCPDCRPTAGPSVMKSVMLRHRHNFDAIAERDLPMQVGTPKFIEEFVRKEEAIPEPPSNVMLVLDEGRALTSNFSFTEEWKTPIKVKKPDGLGMKIPEKNFTINNVVQLIGEDFKVKTIDVYAQQSVHMSLGRFKAAWDAQPRDRLYNILSLEFSDLTALSVLVESPLLVRELSWVEKFWNKDKNSKDADADDSAMYDNSSFRESYVPSYSELHPEHSNSKPPVNYYCLLGMAGSWTDFHIDFGGSSVWYHVHTGEKIFYVVQPSARNLELFADHLVSADRHETFFGDRLPAGELYRVSVKENETFFIPSGWIHSVYTPVDTLVFGGNFLHSLNIPMQLRVYEMEINAKTPESYTFPSFELTNWYAARVILEKLRDANVEKEPAEKYLLDGTEAMMPLLDTWILDSESTYEQPTFAMFETMLKALKREYTKQKNLLARLKAAADSADDESAYLERVGASPKHSPIKLKIKLQSSPRKATQKRGEKSEDSEEEEGERLDVKKVFARRSSRGRQVRPSEKLSQCMKEGEDIQSTANGEGSTPTARTSQSFLSQFTEQEKKEMEMVDKLDEREEKKVRQQAKPTKKTTARKTAAPRSGQNTTPRLAAPKKRQESTVKGRVLAKIAKINRK